MHIWHFSSNSVISPLHTNNDVLVIISLNDKLLGVINSIFSSDSAIDWDKASVILTIWFIFSNPVLYSKVAFICAVGGFSSSSRVIWTLNSVFSLCLSTGSLLGSETGVKSCKL